MSPKLDLILDFESQRAVVSLSEVLEGKELMPSTSTDLTEFLATQSKLYGNCSYSDCNEDL